MSYTQLLVERDSIPIAPLSQTLSNTTATTAAIDMSKFNRAEFIVVIGQGGPAPSVRAWLQQTNNSNGSGGVNITNPASGNQIILTNITGATNNVNTLEVNGPELYARYVTCTVQESAVIQTNITVVGIGTVARNSPANTNDALSTGQRVY